MAWNVDSAPGVLVVGSSNTDMVVRSTALPRPGETVLGGTFFMNPGGKGANQAVAAARLGARVTFVCKVGDDMFGREALQNFRNEGMDTDYVFIDREHPSGVALITVDARAENCIVVASGANANLLPADLVRAEKAVDGAEIVLMQLETPMETIESMAETAARKGKRVILNPAPGRELSPSLLKNLYLITPNETEAGIISGIEVTDTESAVAAARAIREQGVAHVIITLGAKGALVFDGVSAELIPAYKVQAVDTTAAGDVFNGALAVGLAEGMSMGDAVRFAGKAAAISVTRQGAQASAPRREEVERFGS